MSKWASSMRIGVVGAALLAALGSASSNKSTQQPEAASYGAPAPRAMNPSLAIGLWRSSFGAVKIEPDPQQARPEFIQGAWSYQRGNEAVVGVFWGQLKGNVLHFSWQEPSQPAPLEGAGYLVFADGSRFNGKWWTTSGDRSGDWNGWRADDSEAAGTGAESAGEAPAPPPTYGGQTYGAPHGQPYEQPYDETAPVPPPPPPDYSGGPVY
jgi:hypothetical protein